MQEEEAAGQARWLFVAGCVGLLYLTFGWGQPILGMATFVACAGKAWQMTERERRQEAEIIRQRNVERSLSAVPRLQESASPSGAAPAETRSFGRIASECGFELAVDGGLFGGQPVSLFLHKGNSYYEFDGVYVAGPGPDRRREATGLETLDFGGLAYKELSMPDALARGLPALFSESSPPA